MHRTRHSILCFSVAALSAAGGLPAQPACPRGALPAYAHNDYKNPRPLHDALTLGYRGVEADVFLVDGVLRLAHERRDAKRGATLEEQYLAPLRSLIARCATLTSDGQPFLLTVEIKEGSRQAFDTLVALLARYSDLFTAHSGHSRADERDVPAIEVVLVGKEAPAEAADIRFPLRRQIELRRTSAQSVATNDPEVRLISLDYSKTIGRWWLTRGRRRRWLSTLREIKEANPTKTIRVYHVPVNERVYRRLLGAGVDLIGTQDLVATARLLSSVGRP